MLKTLGLHKSSLRNFVERPLVAFCAQKIFSRWSLNSARREVARGLSPARRKAAQDQEGLCQRAHHLVRDVLQEVLGELERPGRVVQRSWHLGELPGCRG